MSICNLFAWLRNTSLHRNTLTSTAQPATMATLSCPSGMKKQRIRSICTSFWGNNSFGTDFILNDATWNYFNADCIYWLHLYLNSESDALNPPLRTPAKTIYDRILVTGLRKLPSVPQLAKVMAQGFSFPLWALKSRCLLSIYFQHCFPFKTYNSFRHKIIRLHLSASTEVSEPAADFNSMTPSVFFCSCFVKIFSAWSSVLCCTLKWVQSTGLRIVTLVFTKITFRPWLLKK